MGLGTNGMGTALQNVRGMGLRWRQCYGMGTGITGWGEDGMNFVPMQLSTVHPFFLFISNLPVPAPGVLN